MLVQAITATLSRWQLAGTAKYFTPGCSSRRSPVAALGMGAMTCSLARVSSRAVLSAPVGATETRRSRC